MVTHRLHSHQPTRASACAGLDLASIAASTALRMKRSNDTPARSASYVHLTRSTSTKTNVTRFLGMPGAIGRVLNWLLP